MLRIVCRKTGVTTPTAAAAVARSLNLKGKAKSWILKGSRTIKKSNQGKGDMPRRRSITGVNLVQGLMSLILRVIPGRSVCAASCSDAKLYDDDSCKEEVSTDNHDAVTTLGSSCQEKVTASEPMQHQPLPSVATSRTDSIPQAASTSSSKTTESNSTGNSTFELIDNLVACCWAEWCANQPVGGLCVAGFALALEAQLEPLEPAERAHLHGGLQRLETQYAPRRLSCASRPPNQTP